MNKRERGSGTWAWLLFTAAGFIVAYLDASGMEPLRLWLIVFVACGLTMFSWSLIEWCILRERLCPRYRALPFALLAFLLVTAFCRPGLKLSFNAYRNDLDRIADRVSAGQSQLAPIRIGPFRIHKAEMRYDSYIALDLNTDENGPTSLVRDVEVPENEWSHIRLSDDWILFSED